MCYAKTYLVNFQQDDLVRSSQIDFVLGINQVRDAPDDIVPFEGVVAANGRANRKLREKTLAEMTRIVRRVTDRSRLLFQLHVLLGLG